MKKLIITGLAAGIAVILSGCGVTANWTPPAVKTVELPDGQELYCIVVDGGGSGVSVDCGWELIDQ